MTEWASVTDCVDKNELAQKGAKPYYKTLIWRALSPIALKGRGIKRAKNIERVWTKLTKIQYD